MAKSKKKSPPRPAAPKTAKPKAATTAKKKAAKKVAKAKPKVDTQASVARGGCSAATIRQNRARGDGPVAAVRNADKACEATERDKEAFGAEGGRANAVVTHGYKIVNGKLVK